MRRRKSAGFGRLARELLFQGVCVLHAIDAEAAEVSAQLAPGREGPGTSPEVERQRMNAADAGLPVFAA